MSKKIAVIGGGAAGLMACALLQGDVTLFEKNPSKEFRASDECFDNAYLGRKLLITGKGRCNVTNACTRENFFANVPHNPKFLYASFAHFPPEKVMDFFERNGTHLKVERGNRVFPVSDKSLDILLALKKAVKQNRTKVICTAVTNVEKCDDVFVVTDSVSKKHFFDAVIVATGGLSYPVTGSTGDGYRFATSFGLDVKKTHPSLVPLEIKENAICRALTGLSLKNVTLTLTENGKKKPLYREMGEMLFTHFGVSGPLVLSASAHMEDKQSETYTLHIDMKVALDEATLDTKLVKLFAENSNKSLANTLKEILPHSMAEIFPSRVGLAPSTPCNAVTKENRMHLVSLLKDFPLTVTGFRPIAEAVITSGGVSVKEINPSTMEAKNVSGLYFVGEVLDVDAYTGGYNLQIAFSTAALAVKALTQ